MRNLFWVFLLLVTACGGGSGGDAAGGAGAGGSTSRTLGGSASGLSVGASVTLQNLGANNLTVSGNGAFAFANPVPDGGTFAVTVLTQPAGETCTVTGGSGTASSNVTSIVVTCTTTPPRWAIGGSVSGLSPGASVTLQDNGGNNLTIPSDGAFAFTNTVPDGGAYAVTVLTPPTGETCTVTSGSGTASGNVSGVAVSCSAAVASCPPVTGAASLSLNSGDPFNGFVLQTPTNAINESYSSFSFDFNLRGTALSSPAVVAVSDGHGSSVSVADMGAVCGLGGIPTFPAKAQFASLTALSLQTGHGYFVEAPDGSYARLYVNSIGSGFVSLAYEHPSVICPPSGVTLTYDTKRTYNGVSITGAVTNFGSFSNNGVSSSASSAPFYGCKATATVSAWGAGGAGGGNFDVVGGAGGGGGGGGGFGTQSIPLVPGQYYLATIGLGGDTGFTNGFQNGKSTAFGTYSASDTTAVGTTIIVSTGGQGGNAPVSHTAQGIGGSGGTSNATGSSIAGVNGTNGLTVLSSPCSPGQSFGIGPGGGGGNAGGALSGGAAGGCTPGTAGLPGGGGAGTSQNGRATPGATGRITISY
jgi:hypothetical protein